MKEGVAVNVNKTIFGSYSLVRYVVESSSNQLWLRDYKLFVYNRVAEAPQQGCCKTPENHFPRIATSVCLKRFRTGPLAFLSRQPRRG